MKEIKRDSWHYRLYHVWALQDYLEWRPGVSVTACQYAKGVFKGFGTTVAAVAIAVLLLVGPIQLIGTLVLSLMTGEFLSLWPHSGELPLSVGDPDPSPTGGDLATMFGIIEVCVAIAFMGVVLVKKISKWLIFQKYDGTVAAPVNEPVLTFTSSRWVKFWNKVEQKFCPDVTLEPEEEEEEEEEDRCHVEPSEPWERH